VKHVVLAATLTPFRHDGSLWLERVPAYLEYLTSLGVDGFLALGTNGEFASLDIDERERVLEAMVEASAGARILANVGGTVVHDVLRLTRHARATGADGVALLPPYYFPTSARAYEELARRVADAFEGPIHLYNIPRYTGFTIPVETVAALAHDGTAVGLKDSSQDLAYLDAVRAAAPRIEYLMGSDTTLIAGLEHGVDGVASGMANTFPDVVVGATRAFERGAPLEAWSDLVRRIRTLFGAHPYLAATRHAIAARGMDVGPVRAPLMDLTPEERAVASEAIGSILASLPSTEVAP